MSRQIKVYSTPNCPWCKKAKQFLQSNNFPFQDFDVASDKAARDEMIKKTGQLAVPIIEIDGETTIGYDENWLRQKLGLVK